MRTNKTIFIFFPILIFSLIYTYISASNKNNFNFLKSSIQKIEKSIDATIGVSVYNKNNNEFWSYNGDMNFPLSSIFKTFASAVLLKQIDTKKNSLEKKITVKKSDVLKYAPILSKNINKSINNKNLIKATMEYSDNTAANLILKQINGPTGFTKFMTSMGDNITNLTKYEPHLNDVVLGDKNNITTPSQITNSLNKVLFGKILSQTSTQFLIKTMINSKVTHDLTRSVLPKGWKIADRSGAGKYGARAITAVLWPPQKKPIIIAIFIKETPASLSVRNKTIADISNMILKGLAY